MMFCHSMPFTKWLLLLTKIRHWISFLATKTKLTQKGDVPCPTLKLIGIWTFSWAITRLAISASIAVRLLSMSVDFEKALRAAKITILHYAARTQPSPLVSVIFPQYSIIGAAIMDPRFRSSRWRSVLMPHF